jgi:hypothetical protein
MNSQIDDKSANVEAALELLQQRAAVLVEEARTRGAEAYTRGDMETFDRIDRRRESFEAFLEQVEDLAEQWYSLGGAVDDGEGAVASNSEREEPLSARDYALPILQVLDEAGGSASIDDVRDGVERILEPDFGPADRATLESGKPRWEVRIDAARQRLKNQGLMSSTTRYGTWEITDRGREILESGDIDEVWSMRSWRSD